MKRYLITAVICLYGSIALSADFTSTDLIGIFDPVAEEQEFQTWTDHKTQLNDELDVATIYNGTATLGTTSIASGTCATTVTVAASGVASTDIVSASFNGDPTSLTGYAPSADGGLFIYGWPTSDDGGKVNFSVCNNTADAITPSAATLNWQVIK